MGFLSNLSLQRRIALLVLVAMVLGLGIFSWLSIQSMNDSNARSLDMRLTIAKIVASHMDDTLEYTLAQVQSEAANDAGPLDMTTFHPRSAELMEVLTKSGIAVERIYLVGPDGTILHIEPDHTDGAGAVLPDYQNLQPFLDKGECRISPLVNAPITGTPVALATAPIMDSGNKMTGALSVAIDVNKSSIGGFIKPIHLGNTGYIEIIDSNGLVLARTNPGQPPTPGERSDHQGHFADLMAQGKAVVGTCHRCHGSVTQPQRRKDVLAFAPLSAAPWGVAVRQSEEEAFALTDQLKRRFFILGGIMVAGMVLVVWVMMRDIVNPIKSLTAAASRMAAGDFKALAPLKRRDEIGQLSLAFSGMAQDLAHARDQLLARNQELTALNSMAATVSQSLDLEDVLAKALEKTMNVTGAQAGCVLLAEDDAQRMKIAHAEGLPALFQCEHAGSTDAQCVCHQVLRSSRTSLANDASLCPALGKQDKTPGNIAGFVSVPLRSKKRAIGVMNLAYSGEGHLDERDLGLLDSIGRQVGLAVENSTLYLEAKRHEELRGQLLTAVISAQEDERKRLARDLHDQAGQALTSLVMGIDYAEAATTPDQKELRKRLSRARTIGSQLLEDMRRIMQDLRSPVLDDLGLVAAVRSYSQTNLEAAGIAVQFEAEGLDNRLPPSIETALFRVVQEAVHNVIKHSQARTVNIRMGRLDGKVTLSVEDDGKGFNVADHTFDPTGARQSFGLIGMRERVTLLGGSFAVNSEPGRGTRILIEVPVDN